ncbi:MAG: hypothetical protein GY793_02920, partial [Proteobacteria bacterium]|nr:hypothetical protein [Pseudomonadota bacterium]
TIRRKTPYLIERNILLLKWLDTLDENWKKSGLFNELIINYPEILAYRQEIVIWLIQDLALTIVGKGEFDCSHPIIERLYQEYIDAMSNDPNRNFFLLYSEKNLRQAKILYQSSIYGGRGGAANYFLSHLCNKEMPEEKYVVVNRLDNFCKFYPNNRVERVFKEELKGLKRAIK